MTSTPFDKLGQNLTALRDHQPRADRAPHPDSLEAMQRAQEYAMSWVATFRRKEADILANGRLSDVGKREETLQVATAAAGDLGPIRRPIEVTKEAMARFKTIALDYMQLPAGQDRLEALLLSQEIRQEFRGRPQHEKDAVFLQAAERQDRTTMRSFQTAPAGPWITGEMLQRAEQVYGERQNPGAWEQMWRLGRLYEYYVSLGRMVALALLAYGLAPDTIEKAVGLTLPEMQIQPPLKAKALEELVGGKGASRG